MADRTASSVQDLFTEKPAVRVVFEASSRHTVNYVYKALPVVNVKVIHHAVSKQQGVVLLEWSA